ncbi:hypothetical protein EUGRSUZ_K01624 [Eucalyptus grandis]|uniref:Protein kinase domain-containing protein n=2 Tax=Eucalyptus grandis TaxID=71139 RepID=A0A059A260_EUCGR|nr:hypothetical protein EUGRSUZ_K01624 [Eucalyptus grandis]
MACVTNAIIYSSELLSCRHSSRPIKVVARTLEILVSLGSFTIKLIFTRLGPTFVKIGQGLSTRPDLCPLEYLEELYELQDALPTFPDTKAFACIEKELGLTLDSTFSQVYKVRLRYSNQLVAVKMQRLGIEEAIGLDFYLIRGLRILINKYVDVITSDEGQNARRFKKLYADKADVLVLDIFWDYTSGKVLTMEYVDGLLEYGYFHVDPHPGNLLATLDGKLAFLDFGIMSETPEDARLAIIGHVVHLVNWDYKAMACDYYALDFLAPDVDVAPIVLALWNFFDDALNATVSELNFKTLVDGLGTVLYRYPFNGELCPY